MSWNYSKELEDHFLNPRNYLDEDEDFQYDLKEIIGNRWCGDEMAIYLQFEKTKEGLTPYRLSDRVIKDVRWQSYGCASAIANMSMLSEMIKGQTVENVLKITPDDLVAKLGDVPDQKKHCSLLGCDLLKKAFGKDYNTDLDKVTESN